MNLGTPIVRYSSLVFALLAGFTNFVACGARMYQISLEDDYTPPPSHIGGQIDPSLTGTYGIHTLDGWGEQLPIPFQFSHELSPDLQSSIINAMGTWEQAVGKKLFALINQPHFKSGDDFPNLYSSLQDHINGHYKNRSWTNTEKSNDVIATTIWDSSYDPRDASKIVISTADIRFNFEHYNIGDSFTLLENDSRSVVDMESLALHEIGHLLGLAHIPESDDSLSIMNPALLIGEGLATRKISRLDIENIQRIYGCEGAACNIDALYYEMSTAQSKQ